VDEEGILENRHQRLSIVIPVYNEVDTLLESFSRIRAVKFPIDTEIIIVDDCSKDGSPNIIESIRKAHPEVLAYRNHVNMGKGATVVNGFRMATGTILTVHDADLEYDPNDLKSMLEIFLEKNYDVMFGNRPLNFRSKSVHRRNILGNIVLSLAASLAYMRPLYDVETCYKLFRREAIDFPIESKRFDFEIELTSKIIRSGYSIHFKKISYSPRRYSQGKKINWRDGLIALEKIVKYRFVRFRWNEEALEPLFRRMRVKRVLEYLSKEKRLLDIGCGQDFKFLRSIRTRIKLGVGIDKSAKESHYGNLWTVRRILDKEIEFGDSTFDVVTMLAVLEHMNHPNEMLEECHRVLREGGSLIITVPSKKSKRVLEFLSYRMGIVSEREISDHKNYFDKRTYIDMLTRAGFKDIKSHSYNLGMNYFIVGCR
jgi:glycosyltransferase involved in cell wall biosynthesis